MVIVSAPPELPKAPLRKGNTRRISHGTQKVKKAKKGGRIKEKSNDFSALIEPTKIPASIPEEDFASIAGEFTKYGDPEGVEGGDLPEFAESSGAENIYTPAATILKKKISIVKPPRVLKRVKPVYPEFAIKSRIQGLLIINAVTDIYGRVNQVKVVRGNPLLRPGRTSQKTFLEHMT